MTAAPEHIIIGSGVAGLTAGYVLTRNGHNVRVFEAEEFIGGASRTVQYNGFRFDLGGHRFYTRNEPVKQIVNELLGNELIEVGRLSRIYLNGRFINYPLTFSSAFRGLGPVRTVGVTLSYLAGRVHGAVREIKTFEDWVVARFGRGLYDFYFAPYSEKVWGVSCTELSADFAAQRIKGLSFREAVKNMLVRKILRQGPPPSLITAFQYPRLGFGRIPERMAEEIGEENLRLSAPVVRVHHDGQRILSVGVRGNNGALEDVPVSGALVSSMPVSNLIAAMDPSPPEDVRRAAAELRFRDMVILFITVKRPQVSPDHWIYFPSRDISFGRIHEPKNWSADMAPPDCTGLLVEFFCFKGDDVWNADRETLIRRASADLERTGLVRADEIGDVCMVRLPKAYPVYVTGYTERMERIMQYLRPFDNLYTIGRNGLFRYTSADYYIDMGLKTAENILGAGHDIEVIGVAQEYAEK